MKGKKWLFIMGLLEVLMGIGTFLFMFWILKQDPGQYTMYNTDTTKLAEDALWALIFIYSAAGLQILLGLLGMILCNSKKAAGFLKVMGLILIVVQGFHYSHGAGDIGITSIVVNSVLLAIPALYYYGAMINKKSS